MLTIKTGMPPEAAVAKKYASPDTLILSGAHTIDDLKKLVPSTCDAILSFGLCGGLSLPFPVGSVVVATQLVSQTSILYSPNSAWTIRLAAKTNSLIARWYSSGKYNEANTPLQRADILNHYHAGVVDDESLSVAQFAKAVNIPFAILRVVSDGFDDDVSITANLLNDNGNVNTFEVIKAFASSPIAMVRIWQNYNASMAALDAAGKALAPSFCWPR